MSIQTKYCVVFLRLETWIFLRMDSVNERRRYYVTPILIGGAHAQKDPRELWLVALLQSNVYIMMTLKWASSCLNSPVTQMFVWTCVYASNKEIITFPHYLPVACGIHRWPMDPSWTESASISWRHHMMSSHDSQAWLIGPQGSTSFTTFTR